MFVLRTFFRTGEPWTLLEFTTKEEMDAYLETLKKFQSPLLIKTQAETVTTDTFSTREEAVSKHRELLRTPNVEYDISLTKQLHTSKWELRVVTYVDV